MFLKDYRAPLRRPATFLQFINPVWWASDVERNMNWSWWEWFKRNSFANFKKVIIGRAHRYRTCYYTNSALTYAPEGWNYGWVLSKWCIPLPFLSHRGLKKEWVIGCMTSGTVTAEWRTANSPNATEYPH